MSNLDTHSGFTAVADKSRGIANPTHDTQPKSPEMDDQTQLTLPFEEIDENKLWGDWSFRTEPDGLVETLGDVSLVYGSWDRLFGCWKINQETGERREIMPRWPIFDERGQWLTTDKLDLCHLGELDCDPWDESDYYFNDEPLPFHPKWVREASAAFAGYVSSMPRVYRLLAAPFDCRQWLALDLMWQVKGFAEYVEQAHATGNLNYIQLALCLIGDREDRRGARRAWGQRIISEPRHKVLSALSGKHCTRGTVRIVNRLNWSTPHLYLHEFMGFVTQPRLAKILGHLGGGNVETLVRVVDVPHCFWNANTLRLVLRDETCADIIADFKRSLLRSEEKDWRRFAQSARSITNGAELEGWAETQQLRHLEWLEFPEPPLEGDRLLTPLDSPKAMIREAHGMRNCLRSLIGYVHDGNLYFYHWAGDEPATVAVFRQKDGTWRFGDARGVGDAELPDATLTRIKATVAALQRKKRSHRLIAPGV